MDMNKVFPSKWLKAADLQNKEVRLTMSRVELEEIGKEEKPVLYFINRERGLVLNVTNTNTIVQAYGSESSEWSEKEIILYPTQVSFQGQQVDAIRVRVPLEEAGEDDVPF